MEGQLNKLTLNGKKVRWTGPDCKWIYGTFVAIVTTMEDYPSISAAVDTALILCDNGHLKKIPFDDLIVIMEEEGKTDGGT